MTNETHTALLTLRQHRRFKSRPVADAQIDELLEIARWTGSSRNSQPWHFIAITDQTLLRELAGIRPLNSWFGDAPLAIALVFDGEHEVVEAYDEGRVTERIMLGADLMGLGSGTAWFGEPEDRERAKKMLGVATRKSLRSVVAIGYPDDAPGPDLPIPELGRKPLAEITSYRRQATPDSNGN